MLTYQDFATDNDRTGFLLRAIKAHMESELYKMAKVADNYDHQKNETINKYVQTIFLLNGISVEDFTASNAKLANNFFNKNCTQRCNYSLGNGVRFTEHIEKSRNEDGVEVSTDTTKEKMGNEFDTSIWDIGYYGIIHGLSFGYYTQKKTYLFKITEFVPLWDEVDGRLRAGIRFWQVDDKKPMTIELYEEDGVTVYLKDKNGDLKASKPKQKYKVTLEKAPIEDEAVVVGEENYNGKLPIIPFWGSRLHQSILVGKQQTLDAYDLINSGFANDITDCSQVYWLIENCGGMSQQDLMRVRDQMKLTHIVNGDTENGKITPYTQEIPYQARTTMLQNLRAQIYEDFCCLDVHTIAAGATNDHIDAAYQPMDDAADDFEFQMIKFIQALLSLIGIEDTPDFKRNRISNQKERTEVVLMSAQYLDEETILSKLPITTPDEVPGIMARRLKEMQDRMKLMQQQGAGGPAGPGKESEEIVV